MMRVLIEHSHHFYLLSLQHKNYFRNEYIENQKRNLQNGFITQQEFSSTGLDSSESSVAMRLSCVSFSPL